MACQVGSTVVLPQKEEEEGGFMKFQEQNELTIHSNTWWNNAQNVRSNENPYQLGSSLSLRGRANNAEPLIALKKYL